MFPVQDTVADFEAKQNIVDVAAKWSSKFNNSATQVDAILGYHYDTLDEGGVGQDQSQIRYGVIGARQLSEFEGLDPDGSIPTGCATFIGNDDNGDGIVNEMDESCYAELPDS